MGEERHTLLFVDACVRPDSRTRRLAQCVLGAWRGRVEHVSPEEAELRPVDGKTLEIREALLREQAYTADLFFHARQFAKADEILIAAPYWDLLFPALLRIYLEAVAVNGITFRYTAAGVPEGLCRAKRLTYVTTAGGRIGEGNYGYAYVKALAEQLFGIPDIRCFSAEGLDIAGVDVEAVLLEAERTILRSLQEKEP